MRVCTQFSYKKIILILWTLLVFCTSGFSTQAFEPMNIPPLADFVVDHAGVLSSGDLQLLNQQWQQIQQDTSAQLAAILIPTQWDYQLVDIGLKVFRETGLGQKDKDNGVLLVINTEQKKIRIVVGYGLEWALPDIAARDIIETQIRPFVNSWLYTQAIQNYYTSVLARIKDEGTSRVDQKIADVNQISILDVIMGWVWFVLFFTAIWYANKKNTLYNLAYKKLHTYGYAKNKISIYGWLLWLRVVSLLVLFLISLWWVLGTFWWMFLWNWLGLTMNGRRWWPFNWWWGWGSGGIDFWWMWWGWGFWWFSWWWGSSGWGWAGD